MLSSISSLDSEEENYEEGGEGGKTGDERTEGTAAEKKVYERSDEVGGQIVHFWWSRELWSEPLILLQSEIKLIFLSRELWSEQCCHLERGEQTDRVSSRCGWWVV